MPEVFHVSVREQTGSRNMQRLRRSGKVPAVLYGHGQPSVNLAIGNDEVKAMVRHGARVVDLEGAVAEKAFVSELQWDAFGREVLHIDLARVSLDERVTVEVPVELKGEAEGVKAGGVMDHVTHTVEVECPVVAIPSKVILRVFELKLDGHLNADKIELPEGVTLVTDAETVIVTCAPPKAEVEAAGGEGAEPEVIGRKAGEEEAAEEK
ncbi:MAG: 50S ribosomal protein L25 [Planctomycetales bacterium]|nr:50S ribosomal protein L25 [Planctomycetales bacterium]